MAECQCHFCWPHAAQCPDGIQCALEVEQDIWNGRYITNEEDTFEDYIQPPSAQSGTTRVSTELPTTPPPSPSSQPPIIYTFNSDTDFEDDFSIPLGQSINRKRQLATNNKSTEQDNNTAATTLHTSGKRRKLNLSRPTTRLQKFPEHDPSPRTPHPRTSSNTDFACSNCPSHLKQTRDIPKTTKHTSKINPKYSYTKNKQIKPNTMKC
jgi:hypothetical protein